MFCKYCGKNSDNYDVCNECNEKINSYMKNSNLEESTVDKNGYDRIMEQTESITHNKEVTEYRGFFTMPRIMGFIGSIIFAFCCIVPMYMYGEEDYLSLIDVKNGETFLLIPLFMLLNTIFDKSITRVTLSGIHNGFLRFKLCIFWGIVGICSIIIYPCAFSLFTNVAITEYTPIFYIAIIGCVLLIIAPFLIKENDGTGIKPVKKYDYIWIVLSVLIAVLLCFATVSKTDELGYNDNDNILEENLEGSVTFDEAGLMGCTYNGNDTVVVGLVMTNNTSQSFKFDDTFELKLFELGTEKSKVTIGSDFPIPDVYGKDMSSQTIESQYPAAIFNAFTVDDISNTFMVKVVSKYDESNVVFTTSDTPYKTAYYENNDEYYADNEPIYDSSYYEDYEIQDLMSEFYSYAWVNSTNNHDSSYVAAYTVEGSPAYQMFGLDYWQERPTLRFDGIYDVNVINIEPKSDGSYDVYVYYTYELYYTDKDRTNSNIELAIDNVVWNGYEFLVNNHTWIDDIPVGSSVSLSDYYK